MAFADLSAAGYTHVGEVCLQRALQLAHFADIALADDAERDPRTPSARRTAATVGVALGFARQIEVDHVRNVLHVDAARRHIGGDEQLQCAAAVARHHTVALLLAEVAVDRVGVVTVLHQVLGEFLRFVLGAAKNDGEEIRCGVNEACKRGVTIAHLHHAVPVVDRFGRGVRAAYVDLLCLAHVALGNAPHFVAHGGAEEPGAFVLAGGFEDRGKVFLEAHVQHLVRLIQYHDVDQCQVDGLTAEQVEQATRCGHHDLRTLADVADLVADGSTTIHGHALDALHVLGEAVHVLGDLHAQLTRRR